MSFLCVVKQNKKDKKEESIRSSKGTKTKKEKAKKGDNKDDHQTSLKKKRKTTSSTIVQDEQPGKVDDIKDPNDKDASSSSTSLSPSKLSSTLSPLYTPIKDRAEYEKESSALLNEMQQVCERCERYEHKKFLEFHQCVVLCVDIVAGYDCCHG